jgi:hypothetical protein
MSAKESQHSQENPNILVPRTPSSADLILSNLDLASIQDERARECVRQLLNLVETLMADLRDARSEVQRLRDEVNRLKGEQGKPDIKSNRHGSSGTTGQHSSERERREPKDWQKSSKLDQIKIDREEILKLDTTSLPSDFKFKGYEPVVVQDLLIITDNIASGAEKLGHYGRPNRARVPLLSGASGPML